MPRSRDRVCLQDGLKLDINQLIRRGVVRSGTHSGGGWQWTSSYWGLIATGAISADTTGERAGSFRITIGNGATQTIQLIARPRHFGGRQWYFVCPRTGRPASVLWRPPGARDFRSRQAWRRQVAYRSQFLDPDNRAYHGQSKIKMRLIGNRDPDDWDLPPKPKGMRWRTYQRYVDRFDRYEDMIGAGFGRLARILARAAR